MRMRVCWLQVAAKKAAQRQPSAVSALPAHCCQCTPAFVYCTVVLSRPCPGQSPPAQPPRYEVLGALLCVLPCLAALLVAQASTSLAMQEMAPEVVCAWAADFGLAVSVLNPSMSSSQRRSRLPRDLSRCPSRVHTQMCAPQLCLPSRTILTYSQLNVTVAQGADNLHNALLGGAALWVLAIATCKRCVGLMHSVQVSCARLTLVHAAC